MYELLFKNINAAVGLNEEEKTLLKTFFTPKTFLKKQFLLQEGAVCKFQAFVNKGILRSYYINEKGNKQIIQFAMENWWISDLLSFITCEPSTYYINALEDSELLLISHDNLEPMLEKVPKMERYFRLLLQKNVISRQRNLIASLSQSSEEKYLKFSSAYPQLVQRIPQLMIASYLGIAPETLSRIRKQMAERK